MKSDIIYFIFWDGSINVILYRFVDRQPIFVFDNALIQEPYRLACDKIMKLAWSRWEEEGDVVDDISFVIVSGFQVVSWNDLRYTGIHLLSYIFEFMYFSFEDFD